MVERKRIGLLFSVSEGWIGGSYYFLNIIAALNGLPDEQKPSVIIYSSDKSGFDAAQEIGYPYLTYKSSSFRYTLFERVVNKFGRILGVGNVFRKGLPKREMEVLFGYYEQLVVQNSPRKIYWIPDFQEHYYPQFIGEQITVNRKKLHRRLIQSKSEFVFSSANAFHDFDKFYKNHRCKTSVVRFAVTHPDYSKISFSDLQRKYSFDGDYFFTPNQFWPHKNHEVILKALTLLKARGTSIKFLFSGKVNEQDSHVVQLMKMISDHELEVIFLGFLPREEQLCIMHHAISVVQPSYFEGWSTVVEDAKAMGKHLILSDIAVHREQTTEFRNVIYFVPDKEEDLATQLAQASKDKPHDIDSPYKKNVQKFAADFIAAVTEL
jgi:glycosyltransferase involved in cell wall biosynthesis